jgi:hypothetical protein
MEEIAMFRTCAIVGLLACAATALAQGPVGYSVQSNGNDHLYRIDLLTGQATDLGLVGLNDAEGVSFGPGGNLYAIGGTVMEFWNITTPPGALVGPTGARSGIDAGLGYYNGVMYNMQGDTGGSYLYTINTGTGAATLVGRGTKFADNIAILNGVGYAADWIFDDSLFKVDLATGQFTLIGGLNQGNVSLQAGSDFYGNTLYNLTSDGRIFTVNINTGAATFVANVSAGTGWEGLAIVPEPASLGLFALALLRRRR